MTCGRYNSRLQIFKRKSSDGDFRHLEEKKQNSRSI